MSIKTVEYTNHFSDDESAVVSEVHYNDKTHELYVTTVRGDTYGYRNVPSFVFWSFKGAKSRGYYWNTDVKRRYTALTFYAGYDFVDANPSTPAVKRTPAPVAVNAWDVKGGDEYTVTFTVSGTITITGDANGYDDAVRKATKVLEENMVGNFTVEGVVKNK